MGLVLNIKDDLGVRLELIGQVLPPGLEVGGGRDDCVVVAHEAVHNWSTVVMGNGLQRLTCGGQAPRIHPCW